MVVVETPLSLLAVLVVVEMVLDELHLILQLLELLILVEVEAVGIVRKVLLVLAA